MQTLADQVSDTLRDWILHGRFEPGHHIEEIPVASMLGVSRTPVRAALALLNRDGLLEYQPKRGYSVRQFEPRHISAAYEVRSVLEGLACRNAAQQGLTEAQVRVLQEAVERGDAILSKGALDPADHEPYQQVNVDIHNTILEASGNDWVRRFAAQAQQIPLASDRLVLWDDYAVILRSHDDHHRIVDALVARDGRRAEELMREHVHYAGLILKRRYQQLAANRVPAAPAPMPAS